MAAAAVASSVGQYKEGRSAKKAGEAGARMDEAAAIDALRLGSWEEARYRRDLGQLQGTQRAVIGARNATASGSALDIIGDTARIGEEDALQIRQNASREAQGLMSQGAERRRQGRAAGRAGMYQAGGTLLTGGSAAYGQWKKGV